MPFLILVGLVGPLAAGALALFGRNERASNNAVQALFIISALSGLIGAILALVGFLSGALEPLRISLAWAWIGEYRLDAWSAFFLALVHGGTLLAAFYAVGYLPAYIKTYSFPALNAATALFVFGMQATLLSASVFGFLFFWEVMSVSAYFLVVAERTASALRAGFIYLVMTHFGVACLFAAFSLLAHGQSNLAFSQLAAQASGLSPFMLGSIFFLFFAGFGSKAGLVPLHQWLPLAHPQAPSHGSALMSGVMLKVAIYGWLRITMLVFPQVPLTWAVVVAAIGFLSAFFGVLMAAVETDLKRLLAWSSVENVGIIFSALGTAWAFNALQLDGSPLLLVALFHLLNHVVFKTGLFLSAGAIQSATHTRDLDELGGLARVWPGFSKAFLILALAAAALPPFGTFFGEWLFLRHLALTASHASKDVAFVIVLALSLLALVSGLAIFTFGKTFSAIFLGRARTEHAERVRPLAFWLTLPVMFCAGVATLLGLGFRPLLSLLTHLSSTQASASPTTVENFRLAPVLFLLVIVLAFLLLLVRRTLTSQRPLRLTETWDCGQPITPNMQYNATGFAAPIRFFFRSLVLARKTLSTERLAPENPWLLKRSLDWSTRSVWDVWLYKPLSQLIVRGAQRIKHLQNGIIQFYILLIFITLAVTLVIAL